MNNFFFTTLSILTLNLASIAPSALAADATTKLEVITSFVNNADVRNQIAQRNTYRPGDLEAASLGTSTLCGFAGCDEKQFWLVSLPLSSDSSDGGTDLVAAIVSKSISWNGQQAEEVRLIDASRFYLALGANTEQIADSIPNLDGRTAAVEFVRDLSPAVAAARSDLQADGAELHRNPYAFIVGGGCGFMGCDTLYLVVESYTSGHTLSNGDFNSFGWSD